MEVEMGKGRAESAENVAALWKNHPPCGPIVLVVRSPLLLFVSIVIRAIIPQQVISRSVT